MSKLYAAQSLVLQRLEIFTDIPCEYVVSGKDCTERVEPAKDRRDSDAIFPFGTIRNSMSAVQLAFPSTPTTTTPQASSAHERPAMSTDGNEESKPLTVSERRRQFESLSREGSSSSSSLSTSSTIHVAEHSPLPDTSRQRALSSAGTSSESAVLNGDRHLRQSSSNSDLNASRRPVPPPPPPRTPKPKLLSPLASPNLRPSNISSNSAPILSLQADKQTLISRKPPPPPPASSAFLSAQRDESHGVERTLSGGNIPVRGRAAAFAGSGPSHPSSRPPTLSARIVSHPGFIPPKPPDGPNHQPRHSISGHPPSSPIIRLHSPPPSEIGNPSLPAPPLPARPSQQSSFDGSLESHSRSGSTDSWVSETLDANSSDSDSTADESNRPVRTTVLSPPPRHPPRQPPRQPPRHASSLPHENVVSSPPSEASPTSSGNGTPTLQVPPPLPARRSPPSHPRELPPLRPPVRSKSLLDQAVSKPNTAPNLTERKPAIGNLPPPPTRTIALGEKPPAPRITPSVEGSNSDSEDDEETPATGGRPIDLLPDFSNSSRRHPVLSSPAFRDLHPHVAAHSGLIAVAGSHVVVSHNRIKIFDLSVSITPLYDIDLKDLPIEWRAKDPRVTSMEFRPAEIEAEHGRFLWLGGRDGTLWELDIYTGVVASIRPAAHGNVVTHVFRHGNNMVTIDENGKALVFSPEADGFGNMLAHSQPRVARISDKQGFVKMIGGMLWTSGGPASGSSGSTQNLNSASVARGPPIRVYDIFSQSAAVKSLLPLEHVGSVTSGTVLQTHPGKIFLGHEGGVITIWDMKSDDGYPTCIEVVKVSTSDVLCLEGVYDRLWAGSRNGTVVAYDIESKPWVVTNSWVAHEGPVNKLFVDPYSVEKCGQLTVVTVGRDEKARFWDGLLGLDWIDKELNKQETSFSSFRDLTVLVVSWNVDAAKPDALSGSPENNEFLNNVLMSTDSPDIIAFGFQELIDLESRKMAAKTVLLGSKKKSNGAISEKVSRSYKMWYDKLVLAVRLAMPPDCPYTVVHAENLVGLFSCIFMKSSERNGLNDVAITTIKRGIGGMYGNKGAIVARLVIDDSSLCFINCHLAAGQQHVRSRNADVAAILDEKELFPSSESPDPVAYAGGGDGTMVMDHEIVFLNGDLNYRIDQRRDAVISAVHARQFDQLLVHDQLRKELTNNRAFRLRDFVEAPITFAPTYKYDRRSSEYDSSEKRRVPAWCDRVLCRCRQPSRVQNLHYQRYEANISDHRPISAAFKVTVKSVDHATRARTKSVIKGLWWEQQHQILTDIRSYLLSSKCI